ncbi:hypothetical protein ACFLV4_04385 [Chloroflexota bacterium]
MKKVNKYILLLLWNAILTIALIIFILMGIWRTNENNQEIANILDEHQARLDNITFEYTATIENHAQILDIHTELINQHSEAASELISVMDDAIADHARVLKDHSKLLNEYRNALMRQQEAIIPLQEKVNEIIVSISQ